MYSSHSRLTLDLITDIHKPYSPASYISKYNLLNNIKSKQWCNIIYTVMLQYSLTLPPPSLPHFCRPMYLYVCLCIFCLFYCLPHPTICLGVSETFRNNTVCEESASLSFSLSHFLFPLSPLFLPPLCITLLSPPFLHTVCFD